MLKDKRVSFGALWSIRADNDNDEQDFSLDLESNLMSWFNQIRQKKYDITIIARDSLNNVLWEKDISLNFKDIFINEQDEKNLLPDHLDSNGRFAFS